MNNMMKLIMKVIFLSVSIAVFVYFINYEKDKNVKFEVANNIESESGKNIENSSEQNIVINPKSTEVQDTIVLEKDILLEVPFILQAPFGNWSDPIFEDACEEAAILMADGWLQEKDFTAQESFDGIMKIVEIEKKELGEYVDASAKDVAKILKKITGSEKIIVQENITLEDIIEEIIRGNLIIVPTNGRKLFNPFYTPPGPVTHMIVIIGYDILSGEFITNDSGTKRGQGFRYNENVLFGAIRDYPTGNHYKNPINESVIKKVMITISK